MNNISYINTIKTVFRFSIKAFNDKLNDLIAIELDKLGSENVKE